MIIHPPFPEKRLADPRRQGGLRVYQDIANHPAPGLAIYSGKLGPGIPEVDFSLWLQQEARAAMEVKAGPYSLKCGELILHSPNGSEVVDCPIIQARDSAISIKDAVKESLRRRVFMLAFLIFPDMDPDPDIIELASRQKVNVIFGSRGIVDEVVRVAKAEKIFRPPAASHIQEEAELFIPGIKYPTMGNAVSHGDSPAASRSRMDVATHQIIIQHVDVVNLYTMGNGAGLFGQSPPSSF